MRPSSLAYRVLYARVGSPAAGGLVSGDEPAWDGARERLDSRRLTILPLRACDDTVLRVTR